MKIIKTLTGTTLNVVLQGRLDVAAAHHLETEIRPFLDGISALIWDLADLEYISSAGLRLLSAAQKEMNKQGKMTVKNANEAITEIFEMTGFTSVLTLE